MTDVTLTTDQIGEIVEAAVAGARAPMDRAGVSYDHADLIATGIARHLRSKLAELGLDATSVPCTAVLRHGPGHMSTTTCRVKGPHTVHEAIYDGVTFAQWTGDEATTGFFDEPPQLDEDPS